MSSQSSALQGSESEHLVGKALAAEPPLYVSAIVLAIGTALALKAILHMRNQPRHTGLGSWRRFRHA